MRTLLLAAMLAFGAAVGRAEFIAPPMPLGYDDPGPVPDQLLPKIAMALRDRLPDPYSVREFSLCQSRVVQPMKPISKRFQWQRAYRITMFKLNTKNQFGGYIGLNVGTAVFRDGQISDLYLSGRPVDTEPAKSWREPCSPITDDHIQSLIKK